MKLIGIAGLPRSGKDSLAELFIERGYFGVSLGDIVRNESRIRHADSEDPISIEHMTETSNFLRETKGADFALQIALDQYQSANTSHEYKGLVVYSVRAPVEADFILNQTGTLIWVEAHDEVRRKRWLVHLREGEEVLELDEFLRQEALQWEPQPGIPPEIQMDVSYVKEKANCMFENNFASLAEFEIAAHNLVDGLL